VSSPRPEFTDVGGAPRNFCTEDHKNSKTGRESFAARVNMFPKTLGPSMHLSGGPLVFAGESVRCFAP
jgi:hypothetical protein